MWSRLMLSAVILLVSSAHLTAQDVLFEGTVTALIDHTPQGEPLAEDEVSYPPVPGTMVLIKGTGRIKDTKTNAQGQYAMKISPTRPVLLFFDGGGDLKPELQMLTADPQKPQNINVTLMTYQQFTERFGRQVLIDDLTRIVRVLRKYEDIPENDLEARIKQFVDFFLNQG
jgi:hypothetical protein